MNVTEVRLSSLEPYSSYRFMVRCRFATGLWSEWSAEVTGQTEEEGKEAAAHATTLPRSATVWLSLCFWTSCLNTPLTQRVCPKRFIYNLPVVP